MRRAPAALTVTAAGLAATVGFHAHRPAPPLATASSGSGTAVTGNPIATIYGTTQVRVTISGGRITGIQALQLPQDDPRSSQISTTAEPALRHSALARQSAAIDAVSGATYTSRSYEASLQSALDRAGFRAADGSRGSTGTQSLQQGEDGHGWGSGVGG